MRKMSAGHMKNFVVLLGAIVTAVALAPLTAQAEYPDKPISYIIPFNPGGESDVTARLQESHLEKILGVGVNVTHRQTGRLHHHRGQYPPHHRPAAAAQRCRLHNRRF